MGLLSKTKKCHVQGVIKSVVFGQESKKENFLAAQSRALTSGPFSQPTAVPVICFRLEPVETTHDFPQLMVRIRTKNGQELLQVGDEVLVKGKLTRDNILEASQVKSLLTGVKINCAR